MKRDFTLIFPILLSEEGKKEQKTIKKKIVILREQLLKYKIVIKTIAKFLIRKIKIFLIKNQIFLFKN